MSLCKPTAHTSQTPRVNPKVNYRLWVITMCSCRFINGNTCTVLLGMLVMGKALSVWGQKGIWEISVLFSQFSCKSKTALKK